MAVTHDFFCPKCRGWVEVTFESYDLLTDAVACPGKTFYGNACEGVAIRTWRKAPGLAGVSEPGTRGIDRTFKAGYDVQAGRIFYDRAERDKYLKRRGLIGLGPQEYQRTLNQSHSDPEPDYSGLEEKMKEAYAENEAGKITKHLVTDAKTLNPVIAKE